MDKLSLEIEEAIENEDVTELDKIFTAYNEALKINTPFGSWLHIAASDGKLKIVQKLLDLGMDINIKGGIFDVDDHKRFLVVWVSDSDDDIMEKSARLLNNNKVYDKYRSEFEE